MKLFFIFKTNLLVLLFSYAFSYSFVPKKTTYDENYARAMVYLSAGAYALSPDDCISRSLPSSHQWSLVNATTTQICDGFANACGFYTIISELTQKIIIVFRGTKGKKQLFIEGWQSIKPGKDFHGMGKVNKYFLKALDSMWNNVNSTLFDQRYKDFDVTFTGHSLGGALASLASMRTVLVGHRTSDKIKLYTFGAPRIGDTKFARNHDIMVPQSFRVVNRLDIVPHLPACTKDLRSPYVDPKDDSKPCDPNAQNSPYHHGIEIWYPNGMEGGKYYECLGTPRNEDFHCSDSLSFEISKYETFIYDHRHYFGHKVPSFGKIGCNTGDPREEILPDETAPYGSAAPNNGSSSFRQGTFGRIVAKVKTIARVFGFL